MDKIGKKGYKSGSPLYTYKGLVAIPPPLGMVYDKITVAKCSIESTKTNAFMNNFAEMKKLKYGVKKCHKMHVGPKTTIYTDIRVHNESGSSVQTDK